MAMKLEFETDNAAFDQGVCTETGRILREIARLIETGEDGTFAQAIVDANGNCIGYWKLCEEKLTL